MIYRRAAGAVIALVAVVALAAAGWKLYYEGRAAGRAQVQQAWDKAALESSEVARKRERELQTAVEGLDRELQNQKARNAAMSRAHAQRLREFEAALDTNRAPAGPSPASGADGPFAAIAGECARALVALDEHARGLAQTAAGLQSYATSVCVSKELQSQ